MAATTVIKAKGPESKGPSVNEQILQTSVCLASENRASPLEWVI